MSHAAECCMKNGYTFVEHHLEPKPTTSPRACRAAASWFALMISGFRAALGTIFSRIPPKVPPPTSSLRSQNPAKSGTLAAPCPNKTPPGKLKYAVILLLAPPAGHAGERLTAHRRRFRS